MSIPPPSPKTSVSDPIDPSENVELEQSPPDDIAEDAKVENNVIVADQEPTTSGPPSDQVRPRLTCLNTNTSTDDHQPVEAMSQPLLQMPGPLNLSDLTLHSPSSRIVGTPFATSSARFEYPFPEGPTTTEPHQATSSTPSPSFPSLASGSTFPGPSSSSSQPQSLATTPPSISHFSPPFPLELPNYSPTHPKMRTGNPPVPPGLVKKRGRWSLGLLRRRSTNGSSGSQSSAGGSRSPGLSLSPSIPIDIVGDHVVRRDSSPQISTIPPQPSQREGQMPRHTPTL